MHENIYMDCFLFQVQCNCVGCLQQWRTELEWEGNIYQLASVHTLWYIERSMYRPTTEPFQLCIPCSLSICNRYSDLGFKEHLALLSRCVLMTKTGGVTRREARKGIKKSKDLMAFAHDVPLSPSPRDHRQRKLASILAGLNHLRAPVVSCLNAFQQ